MTAPPVTSMVPPMEVPPPAFTPYRYGLLSAAQVLDGGGRWELGGVVYASRGCPNTTDEWTTRCPADPAPPGPPPEKTIHIGLTEVSAKPFLLYDAASCFAHSGRTETELTDFAEANLIAGEQRKLEEKFWAQLRAAATIVPPPTGSTVFDFCLGVGVLDDLIAKQYGGIGVVHAPRYMIGPAAKDMATRYVGDRLLDPADNPWAFGAGYDRKGPPVDGDPDNEAPAGQVWLYGTGPVVLRRSEIQTHSTFGIRDNERRALAERNYVLTAECPALAVLVDIPEC